jgi:hypothetical protein
MTDRISQHINEQLRAVRARSFSPDDADGINRALREAAGFGPAPEPQQPTQQQQPGADPRTARGRLLAEAAAGVRDSEPVPGLDPEAKWNEWIWSRPVVTLLDQQGRLPGERGFDAGSTGLAIGQAWDVEQAIDSRRRRWQNTFGGTP